MIFIDTSAIFAMVVSNDCHHGSARKIFESILGGNRQVETTSFIIVESCALLQNRISKSAVFDFINHLLPLINVKLVDNDLFHEGMIRYASSGKKTLSLVDCISFCHLDKYNISDVFCFDKHFLEEGYTILR